MDARVLDGFRMDSSQLLSSNAIKGSVFRMQGYSIRVRQFFLQVKADALDATDVQWMYLSDDGRLQPLTFVFASLRSRLPLSSTAVSPPTLCNTCERWSWSGASSAAAGSRKRS